jgi:hypothetical protein
MAGWIRAPTHAQHGFDPRPKSNIATLAPILPHQRDAIPENGSATPKRLFVMKRGVVPC